jgi:UDP-N-acetylmuramoyl-tripeptide--D-alanyl-D-alanine ligase
LRLILEELAAWMGGRVVSGDARLPVSGFSIDTRTLAPGDLFFAIKGDRLDGHDFLPAAASAGAGAVVVHRDAAAAPPGAYPAVVCVDDTTRALQALAGAVRRRSGTTVVAITGSAGKTTTKEATAEFLGARFEVFRNRGNLNNHIGLPLSLLELRSQPAVAVVELGMSHAGEIRTLVGIAAPEVRVWTNVSEVHAEFFPSLDAIADAKAEILEAAAPGDCLVANADDPLVMARAARFAGRTITFGMERPADVFAAGVRELGLAGTTATVHTPAGSVQLQTPLLGRVNLANVLAAAAAAVIRFDVPLDDIVTRAAALRPAGAPGRGLAHPCRCHAGG